MKLFLGPGDPSVAYVTSVRWPSLKSVSTEAKLALHHQSCTKCCLSYPFEFLIHGMVKLTIPKYQVWELLQIILCPIKGWSHQMSSLHESLRVKE